MNIQQRREPSFSFVESAMLPANLALALDVAFPSLPWAAVEKIRPGKDLQRVLGRGGGGVREPRSRWGCPKRNGKGRVAVRERSGALLPGSSWMDSSVWGKSRAKKGGLCNMRRTRERVAGRKKRWKKKKKGIV